jgi:hypothetical protein
MTEQETDKLKSYISKLKLLGIQLDIEYTDDLPILHSIKSVGTNKVPEIDIRQLNNSKIELDSNLIYYFHINYNDIDYSVQNSHFMATLLQNKRTELINILTKDKTVEIEQRAKSLVENPARYIKNFARYKTSIWLIQEWLEYKMDYILFQNNCSRSEDFDTAENLYDLYNAIYRLNNLDSTILNDKINVRNLLKVIELFLEYNGNMFDIFTGEVQDVSGYCTGGFITIPVFTAKASRVRTELTQKLYDVDFDN